MGIQLYQRVPYIESSPALPSASSLDLLPTDIIRQTATYLDDRSINSLNTTSRFIHKSLGSKSDDNRESVGSTPDGTRKSVQAIAPVIHQNFEAAKIAWQKEGWATRKFCNLFSSTTPRFLYLECPMWIIIAELTVAIALAVGITGWPVALVFFGTFFLGAVVDAMRTWIQNREIRNFSRLSEEFAKTLAQLDHARQNNLNTEEIERNLQNLELKLAIRIWAVISDIKVDGAYSIPREYSYRTPLEFVQCHERHKVLMDAALDLLKSQLIQHGVNSELRTHHLKRMEILVGIHVNTSESEKSIQSINTSLIQVVTHQRNLTELDSIPGDEAAQQREQVNRQMQQELLLQAAAGRDRGRFDGEKAAYLNMAAQFGITEPVKERLQRAIHRINTTARDLFFHMRERIDLNLID